MSDQNGGLGPQSTGGASEFSLPSGSTPPGDHPDQGDSLLHGYAPSAQHFDEYVSPAGEVHAHCQHVLGSFGRLGRAELRRRKRESQRLLRESGVTYRVYGDPPGEARPWTLDPLPLVISAVQWQQLEAGLAQRAELLNLILADVYGPQRLIQDRLLPADLVFGSPGFLYPCYPQPASSWMATRPLVLYAADLARRSDGEYLVIGDRTQAPSGAGYALENRLVMSRVFPTLYRNAHVERLAGFFRTVRETLTRLAPPSARFRRISPLKRSIHQQSVPETLATTTFQQPPGYPRNPPDSPAFSVTLPPDDPHVVVLTPGQQNETYFEHSYLANYLGYDLVQGTDLTVVDQQVSLKTLDELQPVQVILRRLDDTFCDPLELRPDSLLGTAGLVQAVRQGQVSVVNPLGSGVVENPALLAFLPRLSRHLLGADLQLPSVKTWWCGRTDDRNHVLSNLEDLIVRSVDSATGRALYDGREMSSRELAILAQKIRRRPARYVGQEAVPLSTAAAVVPGELEPRGVVLRTFLVARENDYLAMPGGLTRIGARPDQTVVSNQTGGQSKDTWVLASEPHPLAPWEMPSARPLGAFTPVVDSLPRRVADNLFWLGRYTERGEDVARLLREILLRVLDSDPEIGLAEGIPDFLRILTHHTGTYPGFASNGAISQDPTGELVAIMADPSRTGGLRFNLLAAVQAGAGVRERLSEDAWRLLNSLEDLFNAGGRTTGPDLSTLLELADRVVQRLAGFGGLMNDSMRRGPSWRFVELGRGIERALSTLSLLRWLVPRVDTLGVQPLGLILAVSDSSKTYRLRYGTRLQTDAVLDLALLDETHPRSVAFQFARLASLIEKLPPREAPVGQRPGEAQLAEVSRDLRTAILPRTERFHPTMPGQDVSPTVSSTPVSSTPVSGPAESSPATAEFSGGEPPPSRTNAQLAVELAAIRRKLMAVSELLAETHFRYQTDLPHQLVKFE